MSKSSALMLAAAVAVAGCASSPKRGADPDACPRAVALRGVELCTESFGDPKDPAVLLIMGATASMLGWDEAFAKRLAAKGRFVIRYDHRDTGRSTFYPTGAPGYSLNDLAEDAVALLDAYRIEKAHLMGASMGGMAAQIAALEHPERVLSLTLLMSSPSGPEDPDLPPMDEDVLAALQSTLFVDWSDPAAVSAFRLGLMRLMAGTAEPFDEAGMKAMTDREARRAKRRASMMNHALLQSTRWRERLGSLSVPTVVLHGSEDPVLPLGHGEALAREIPGAKLVVLPGAGHELPKAFWDTAIEEHLLLERP